MSEIISDTLIIHKSPEKDIIADLVKTKYDSSDPDEPNFDYLLNMNIRSMSQDKIDKLSKEIKDMESAINTLTKTSEEDLWKQDLQKFKTKYEQFNAQKIAMQKKQPV